MNPFLNYKTQTQSIPGSRGIKENNKVERGLQVNQFQTAEDFVFPFLFYFGGKRN
jgi:hypothetical protein